MKKTRIIFATNNPNKVLEIQHALGAEAEIISLKEAGIDIEIPEPHNTLQANASEKSVTIHKLTGLDCFSEDTGLEVVALNGAPGVRSARFAGDHAESSENITLLLHKMQGMENRDARFRTVISLISEGKELFFEGVCEGIIAEKALGENGFGYDPVFIPNGSNKRFAEMGREEKNTFSHRRKAANQLIAYLKSAPQKSNEPNGQN